MKTTFKEIRRFVKNNPEMGYVKASEILNTTPEVINHAINFISKHKKARISRFHVERTPQQFIDYVLQHQYNLTCYYVNTHRDNSNGAIFAKILNELLLIKNILKGYAIDEQVIATIEALYTKQVYSHRQYTDEFIC